MDYGPLVQLGCSLVKHGECLQFGVNKGYISKNSCNKLRHHIPYPLCLCMLISPII
jgi:hypothetical protein